MSFKCGDRHRGDVEPISLAEWKAAVEGVHLSAGTTHELVVPTGLKNSAKAVDGDVEIFF